MRALAVAVTLVVALAGCSGGDGKGTSPGPGNSADAEMPMLHGYVVDPAIRPLEGVVVKVIDNEVNVTTTAEGFFGFEDLPTEQFLVVVASLAGYIPASKQVTLVPDQPVRLNFTLEPEPIKSPSVRVQSFEGFLACEASVTVSGSNQTHDCGAGTDQRNRWDFSVDPDLAGAVIEVFWDAKPGGESMGARLETLELGQLNVVLGEVVGPSGLRITVPPSAAQKYYPGGGLMRLSVYAASDAHQNEAGVGQSLQVQQAFQAYTTLFYVETPQCFSSYTFADPCVTP